MTNDMSFNSFNVHFSPSEHIFVVSTELDQAAREMLLKRQTNLNYLYEVLQLTGVVSSIMIGRRSSDSFLKTMFQC